MMYQDINLLNVGLWKEYKELISEGEYERAQDVYVNTQLDNKKIDASVINSITSKLMNLESQGLSSTWDKNVMYVGYRAPSQISSGECYCKLIKEVII